MVRSGPEGRHHEQADVDPHGFVDQGRGPGRGPPVRGLAGFGPGDGLGRSRRAPRRRRCLDALLLQRRPVPAADPDVARPVPGDLPGHPRRPVRRRAHQGPDARLSGGPVHRHVGRRRDRARDPAAGVRGDRALLGHLRVQPRSAASAAGDPEPASPLRHQHRLPECPRLPGHRRARLLPGRHPPLQQPTAHALRRVVGSVLADIGALPHLGPGARGRCDLPRPDRGAAGGRSSSRRTASRWGRAIRT